MGIDWTGSAREHEISGSHDHWEEKFCWLPEDSFVSGKLIWFRTAKVLVHKEYTFGGTKYETRKYCTPEESTYYHLKNT